MSSPGLGAPVDQLDRTCKTYKDCQACTRARYGKDCVPEFTRYDWRLLDNEVRFIDSSVIKRTLRLLRI